MGERGQAQEKRSGGVALTLLHSGSIWVPLKNSVPQPGVGTLYCLLFFKYVFPFLGGS